jgi:hypothetical protein
MIITTAPGGLGQRGGLGLASPAAISIGSEAGTSTCSSRDLQAGLEVGLAEGAVLVDHADALMPRVARWPTILRSSAS